MISHKILASALVLTFGTTLVACGGGGGAATPEAAAPTTDSAAPTPMGTVASEPVSYEVTTLDALKDGLSPATLSAAPGQTVKLTLNNSAGALEHSWVLLKKEVTLDEAKLMQRGSGDEKALYTLEVKPASKASGEFVAPAEAGDYIVICHIPGHAAAGMVGKLTVH